MGELTREIGIKIRCTVGVSSHGLMADTTLESIKMIKNMEMEPSPGLIRGNTSEDGRMENSMVWVHMWQIMEVGGKESGKKEEESDGLMNDKKLNK